MNIEWTRIASPVGELTIAAYDGRLVNLCFEGWWTKRHAALARRFPDSRFVAVKDPAGAVC